MNTEKTKIVKEDARGKVYDCGDSIFYITRNAGTISADHQHKEAETLVLIEGEIELTIESEIQTLRAVTRIEIPPHTYHKLKAITEIKLLEHKYLQQLTYVYSRHVLRNSMTFLPKFPKENYKEYRTGVRHSLDAF